MLTTLPEYSVSCHGLSDVFQYSRFYMETLNLGSNTRKSCENQGCERLGNLQTAEIPKNSVLLWIPPIKWWLYFISWDGALRYIYINWNINEVPVRCLPWIVNANSRRKSIIISHWVNIVMFSTNLAPRNGIGSWLVSVPQTITSSTKKITSKDLSYIIGTGRV